MQKLLPTNCDYAKVVKMFITYQLSGWTMKQASAIMFHKAQTRLGELERSLDKKGKPRSITLKVRRLPVLHTKPNGKVTSITNYKSLASQSYLINLHNKLCREGVKALKK